VSPTKASPKASPNASPKATRTAPAKATPTLAPKPKRVRPAKHALDLPPTIHTMSSDEALPLIAAACGGRCLVSFSGGKDAVASVLALKAAGFTELHLYHLYLVPGLRMVEQSLTYYERLWQTRITRLPHPEMYRALAMAAWQPWHRVPLLERWDAPTTLTFDDMAREVRRDLGWSAKVPQAVGIRMDDSIFRKQALTHSGVYQRHRNVIYPVFDWTRTRVRDALITHQVRLPPEYAFFGRSFSGDGWDYKFIAPLKAHYPDDFERMCQWYPLLRAEWYRYEFSKQRDRAAARRRTTFAL
jgi:hypothetical protein